MMTLMLRVMLMLLVEMLLWAVVLVSSFACIHREPLMVILAAEKSAPHFICRRCRQGRVCAGRSACLVRRSLINGLRGRITASSVLSVAVLMWGRVRLGVPWDDHRI